MIRVQSISFSYGKNKVLQDFSEDFKEKINVIIGPNAAGKSTLIKCIFGILHSKGHVFWQGENIADMTEDQRRELMVYLPQQDMKDTMLTVFETVLLGRINTLSWTVQEEDLEKVYTALHCLGIEDLAQESVSNLSGGQKKLVSICQTLVRDPKVILMDEPTNSLDMQKQLELFEIISQISRYKEITFLIVLHDLNLACRYAQHLTIMNKGGIKYASGNPKEIVNPRMIKEVYGVNATIVYDQKGNPVISPESSTTDIHVFGEFEKE